VASNQVFEPTSTQNSDVLKAHSHGDSENLACIQMKPLEDLEKRSVDSQKEVTEVQMIVTLILDNGTGVIKTGFAGDDDEQSHYFIIQSRELRASRRKHHYSREGAFSML